MYYNLLINLILLFIVLLKGDFYILNKILYIRIIPFFYFCMSFRSKYTLLINLI